jgi:hypothetical protein
MSNLFLKYKQSTNKIHLTQEDQDKEEKKERTTKARSLAYFLLALFCATSLFSFEFFPDETENHKKATIEWRKSKEVRGKLLSKIKKLSIGTPEYIAYKLAVDKTEILYEKLKKVRKKDRVFGFTNMQQFFGEFGPMLCFFIYALFNLIRSLYFERENLGSKIIHSLIIFGTIFYLFWIFQQFQDFSKITYYLVTFVSAALVSIAVWLITKYEEHYINVLKSKYLNLVKFTFNNTKEERRKEMLSMLSEAEKE